MWRTSDAVSPFFKFCFRIIEAGKKFCMFTSRCQAASCYAAQCSQVHVGFHHATALYVLRFAPRVAKIWVRDQGHVCSWVIHRFTSCRLSVVASWGGCGASKQTEKDSLCKTCTVINFVCPKWITRQDFYLSNVYRFLFMVSRYNMYRGATMQSLCLCMFRKWYF